MEKFQSSELELMKTYKLFMRYINWKAGGNWEHWTNLGEKCVQSDFKTCMCSKLKVKLDL